MFRRALESINLFIDFQRWRNITFLFFIASHLTHFTLFACSIADGRALHTNAHIHLYNSFPDRSVKGLSVQGQHFHPSCFSCPSTVYVFFSGFLSTMSSPDSLLLPYVGSEFFGSEKSSCVSKHFSSVTCTTCSAYSQLRHLPRRARGVVDHPLTCSSRWHGWLSAADACHAARCC
jgi:hypothetical protein